MKNIEKVLMLLYQQQPRQKSSKHKPSKHTNKQSKSNKFIFKRFHARASVREHMWDGTIESFSNPAKTQLREVNPDNNLVTREASRHCRFTDGMHLIKNVEVSTNSNDIVSKTTPYNGFAEHLRWAVQTTEEEKANYESWLDNGYQYDFDNPKWGDFLMAPDRDCVGAAVTPGAGAYINFKASKQMEKDLYDND